MDAKLTTRRPHEVEVKCKLVEATKEMCIKLNKLKANVAAQKQAKFKRSENMTGSSLITFDNIKYYMTPAL